MGAEGLQKRAQEHQGPITEIDKRIVKNYNRRLTSLWIVWIDVQGNTKCEELYKWEHEAVEQNFQGSKIKKCLENTGYIPRNITLSPLLFVGNDANEFN